MDLAEYLKGVAFKVNCEAEEYSLARDTVMQKASAHLLTAGGKRLRPALVLLAAEAVRAGAAEEVFPAALALEWTHTFTLVHDDIMDKDEMRRGTPTVHTEFGEPTAILAGDVLAAKGFEYLCKSDAPAEAKVKAVQMLSHTVSELCEGQQEDISFESRGDVTMDEYLSMVRKKTGVLYAAAAGIGGILAGADPRQTAALYTLGLNIGIAFQMQDDLLDLTAPTEVLGKPQGSDLRENKQSAVAIAAREAGVDLARFHKAELCAEEIAEAISLLESAGVLEKIRAYSKKIIDDAKAGLACLADSEAKTLICEMADYFIARNY
ncbi:MAG TPA: polyprenyl synthetase family protein [Methanocorpusculum sp.]|nr:polyprenyl synthetase family protein [Methanocorpusculum sp.]